MIINKKLFLLIKQVVVVLSTLSVVHGSEVNETNCPILPELGQMLMVKLPFLSKKMPLEKQKAYLKKYSKKIAKLKIGGAIIFSANIRKAKNPNDIIDIINILQEGKEVGMFMAIDQEGGIVQRMNASRGFTKLPNARQVGAASAQKAELAYNFGMMTARELSAVGVNWNFAPVLDIESNPNNPVIAKLNRALSADPELVGIFGSDIARGMADYGVIPTAKHFPGHGDTSNDSHYGVTKVEKNYNELEMEELKPFIKAIASGIDSIMVGHISLPKLCNGDNTPSTLSKYIVTEILRKKLGFDGLIVTDDLVMGAITDKYPAEVAAEKAILAGNDVLILGSGSESKVLKHICAETSKNTEKGKELVTRIRESYKRIIATKEKYGIAKNNPTPRVDKPLSHEEHQRIVKEILKLAGQSKQTKKDKTKKHEFLTK